MFTAFAIVLMIALSANFFRMVRNELREQRADRVRSEKFFADHDARMDFIRAIR